jgi:hypothetical protein
MSDEQESNQSLAFQIAASDPDRVGAIEARLEQMEKIVTAMPEAITKATIEALAPVFQKSQEQTLQMMNERFEAQGKDIVASFTKNAEWTMNQIRGAVARPVGSGEAVASGGGQDLLGGIQVMGLPVGQIAQMIFGEIMKPKASVGAITINYDEILQKRIYQKISLVMRNAIDEAFPEPAPTLTAAALPSPKVAHTA